MSPHAFSLRGGGNSEGVVFKEFSLPRFLAEEDVKPGSQNGYCASRTSLDTFQEGQAVASGTMFSVTALEDIEIQAFEFLSAAFINEQQVEIYTRAGGEYVSVSSKPDQWDLVSTTVGIDSADKLWTMAPRADMTSKINMKKGDSRSFYFTLKSQNLKLLATDNKVRDDLYVEDGRLQINVGVGLRFYPFPQLVDQDRAFQGRIHYQTTDKPCDEWMEESTTTMSFAVNSTARIQDVNVALTKELKDSLENAAILSRLKTVHGLELEDINPQPKDVDDCKEYGFAGGCQELDVFLSFKHFQTLSYKQLVLDLTRVFSSSASDGVFVSNSDFKLKYIGDQVFNGNYDIILTGVPSDTILNPSQRNYIEGVAFDFLEQHVDGVYALEVLGQVIETSGQRLRGLQESGTAQVGATVYGIGENPEAFFENVDDAFSKYQSQFLKEISLSQYRPGEINDNENYGKLFGDLFSVTVLRSQTNVTNTNNVSGDGETGFTSEMQIIMWSVILALSVLFLIYKCATDFFCVGAGNRIKKQTLSNKMKRDKKDQALLDNLGKKTPQQRPNSFSNSEKAKEDDSRTVERPGRAEPSKRGIGKSNTFNGPEGFFGSKPKPDDNKSGGRREPSRRGVGRSSTFSGVEGFFGSNRNAPESERPARREPTRGVGKSNTFSGVDGFFGSSRPESSGRREPSKRGVQRSNTSEGAFLRESPATSASGGREAPASRGVGNSNSFGGFFGDRPPRRPKKNKEEKKKKKKKKSSSSEKKSKKSPRKKTAPRKQRSDAPPPRAPTTDRSPAMPPRSRRVDMVGQRRPSL